MRSDLPGGRDLVTELDPPDSVVDELVQRSLERGPRTYRKSRMMALTLAVALCGALWLASQGPEGGPGRGFESDPERASVTATETETETIRIESVGTTVVVSRGGQHSLIQVGRRQVGGARLSSGSIQIVRRTTL